MSRGNSISLSPRLMAAVSLVKGEAAVIDVGTDHAAIPIYLAKNRYVSHIIATEICEGPMAKASLNIEKAGLKDKIRLVLCAGLSLFNGSEAGCIIICGMGGDTIIEIIEAAAFLKEYRHRLILQPMTKAEKLRRYLYSEKFRIRSERLVVDVGRLYVCIEAFGFESGETDGESIYANSKLILDPNFSIYAERTIARLIKIKNSRTPDDERYRDEDLDEEIRKLSNMRTRWENCRR